MPYYALTAQWFLPKTWYKPVQQCTQMQSSLAGREGRHMLFLTVHHHVRCPGTHISPYDGVNATLNKGRLTEAFDTDNILLSSLEKHGFEV